MRTLTPAARSSSNSASTGRVWHVTTSSTSSSCRLNALSWSTTRPSWISATVVEVITSTGCLNGFDESTSASVCANRLRSTYMWMTSQSAANSRFSVTIVTLRPMSASQAAVSAAA